MAKAKKGDNVQIQYTLFLKDGSVFDSTNSKEPFVFTLGEGRVIPGIEEAITGMDKGDRTTVKIPPEDAYGHYNKEAIAVIDRTRLPSNIEPEAGMKLKLQGDRGKVSLVTILDINDNTVTLDCNHPLAGEELTFEIQLLEIF